MSDDADKTQPSLPAPAFETEPPASTDPGGHEPIEETDSARELTPAESLAESLVRAVTAAVDSRLAGFGTQLATTSGKLSEFGQKLEQHQKAEERYQLEQSRHQARVAGVLDEVIGQWRSFGQRLTELEKRVGQLEALIPTERPAAAEPGGEG